MAHNVCRDSHWWGHTPQYTLSLYLVLIIGSLINCLAQLLQNIPFGISSHDFGGKVALCTNIFDKWVVIAVIISVHYFYCSFSKEIPPEGKVLSSRKQKWEHLRLSSPRTSNINIFLLTALPSMMKIRNIYIQ